MIGACLGIYWREVLYTHKFHNLLSYAKDGSCSIESTINILSIFETIYVYSFANLKCDH
jgi:hypothetical protein